MKMHLNLATRDLDASVVFYRTLLLAEPVKYYADYALFVTDEPGLELALDLDPATDVRESAHYGVVVENSEAVDAAIERLKAAGYPVDVEIHETCCYAEQNKVWATDPDGRRWETYFVVAETEVRDTEVRDDDVHDNDVYDNDVHDNELRQSEERDNETTTCCKSDAAVALASPACC